VLSDVQALEPPSVTLGRALRATPGLGSAFGEVRPWIHRGWGWRFLTWGKLV
jgi:hypothetical protein